MAYRGEWFHYRSIDLRGHGEHPLDLDIDILSDVETAIMHFREMGKVTAVGHSLGGRLSLISSADYSLVYHLH